MRSLAPGCLASGPGVPLARGPLHPGPQMCADSWRGRYDQDAGSLLACRLQVRRRGQDHPAQGQPAIHQGLHQPSGDCRRSGRRHPQERVDPYLLRDLRIGAPNEVWCADITDVPMRRGFLTWWQSWIGSAATYWLGSFPIRRRQR